MAGKLTSFLVMVCVLGLQSVAIEDVNDAACGSGSAECAIEKNSADVSGFIQMKAKATHAEDDDDDSDEEEEEEEVDLEDDEEDDEEKNGEMEPDLLSEHEEVKQHNAGMTWGNYTNTDDCDRFCNKMKVGKCLYAPCCGGSRRNPAGSGVFIRNKRFSMVTMCVMNRRGKCHVNVGRGCPIVDDKALSDYCKSKGLKPPYLPADSTVVLPTAPSTLLQEHDLQGAESSKGAARVGKGKGGGGGGGGSGPPTKLWCRSGSPTGKGRFIGEECTNLCKTSCTAACDAQCQKNCKACGCPSTGAPTDTTTGSDGTGGTTTDTTGSDGTGGTTTDTTGSDGTGGTTTDTTGSEGTDGTSTDTTSTLTPIPCKRCRCLREMCTGQMKIKAVWDVTGHPKQKAPVCAWYNCNTCAECTIEKAPNTCLSWCTTFQHKKWPMKRKCTFAGCRTCDDCKAMALLGSDSDAEDDIFEEEDVQ